MLKYQYVIQESIVEDEDIEAHHAVPEDFETTDSNNATDVAIRHLRTVIGGKFDSDVTDILTSKLLAIVDENGDGRLSVAEATTAYRLAAYQYEFLVVVLLADEELSVPLRGHCGEIYSLDVVEISGKEIVGEISALMDELKHFFLVLNWRSFVIQSWATLAQVLKMFRQYVQFRLVPVDWKERIDYGLGVLNLADRLAALSTTDRFYVCDMHDGNFGRDGAGRVRLLDADSFFSQSAVDDFYSQRPCQDDSDCELIVLDRDNCHGACNRTRGTCSFASTTTLLYAVCLHVLPRTFRAENTHEYCPADSTLRTRLYDALTWCMTDALLEMNAVQYRELTLHYRNLFARLASDFLSSCPGIGASSTI